MAKQKASVSGLKTNDGVVHLKPIGFFDPFMTLCGHCDVLGEQYSDTDEACTCAACLSEFTALKDGLRRVQHG